jgi:hypothetical protein
VVVPFSLTANPAIPPRMPIVARRRLDRDVRALADGTADEMERALAGVQR